MRPVGKCGCRKQQLCSCAICEEDERSLRAAQRLLIPQTYNPNKDRQSGLLQGEDERQVSATRSKLELSSKPLKTPALKRHSSLASTYPGFKRTLKADP